MISTTFKLIVLSLLTIVSASSDFTGEAVGLGTTTATTFKFNNVDTPSIWKVFSRTGPQASTDLSQAVLTIEDAGKASIITSEFVMWYGRCDWVAKVAAGEVITSFKLSAAKSGLGLLISGAKPTQIIGSYNGTHADKDIIETYKDLSQEFHKYSMEWTSEKITWLVDDQIEKVMFKDQLTNPIDIANWPTTPDTVNFMIESTASTGNTKHSTYLQSITIQDYTGGKFYQSSNGNVEVITSGDSITTSGNVKVTYPKDLGDWVSGSISKRENASSSISSAVSSITTTTAAASSSTETATTSASAASESTTSASSTSTATSLSTSTNSSSSSTSSSSASTESLNNANVYSGVSIFSMIGLALSSLIL